MERRLHPRRATLIPAFVVDGPQPGLSCTIVDISDYGARLLIEGAHDLPDHFTIALTPSGFPQRACRLVWHSDSQVGVAFESVKPKHTDDCVLEPGCSVNDAFAAFAPRQQLRDTSPESYVCSNTSVLHQESRLARRSKRSDS